MALGQPYNFLYLVNRVCHKFNEVELNASNFATAQGFYTDAQESVNAIIRDICAQEDVQWPFLWNNTTLTTTVGTNYYTANTNAIMVDWDSFYIERPIFTLDSVTSTGTTATATKATGHQLQTGDSVVIQGATQTGYNGTVNITVISSVQFTYPVTSGLASPATGTIQMVSPVTTRKLTAIDYDSYREEGYLNTDGEAYTTGMYGIPKVIVRRADNNILMSPKPDRIYSIPYDYYSYPADLVNSFDVPVIPEAFKQVIVDGAIYHAYMFRDNAEEATAAKAEYETSVNRMRRILIPQQYYMRIDPSLRGSQ